MAKTKKIGKKHRFNPTLFNYTSEQLKNALEAVKNGMPVLAASKTFKVPRSTLRYKVSGDRPESFGKVGPNCVLGDDVEKLLCDWMKASCAKGFPVTRDGLCYSVQKIANEVKLKTPFTNNRPGRKWFESFMSRHPELSVKKSEYISKARAAVTAEKIRKWFQNTLDDLRNEATVLEDPKRIWNMDETAFYLNPSGGCVIAEKGKHVYATSMNSDKENVTTLITVNAVGDYAPPLTLYKFERIPATYFKSAPLHWGIGKSKNGWMTAETFYDYMVNIFHPFLIEQKYTLPVIMFLDGHSSHLSLHLSKFCRDNGIVVVCLYPNTTHILQPLDVAVFFPLKCHWKKELRTWRLEHDGREIRKQDVPNLLNSILTKISFKTTIINGFRKCGLYPYEPNNVDYSKCVNRSSTIPVQLHEDQTVNLDTVNIDYLNFKKECLSYIETKIEPEVLSDFIEKHQQKKETDIKEAQMLFDVWESIKCDVDSNEDKEVSDDTPDFREDIIEFPFPEFNHVTAEKSSSRDINSTDDFSWICKTIDKEAIKFFEEKNAIKEFDTNLEILDVSNDQTLNILIKQIDDANDKNNLIEVKTQDQAFNKPENKTKPIISDNDTSEIEKPKQSDTNMNIDLKNSNNIVIKATNESNCDSTESEIFTNKTGKQNMGCEYKINEEMNKENMDIETQKINILSNILLIPEPKINQVAKKRIYTSSVLTSAKWIEMEEKKERVKLDALKKKEENKKKRAENKQKRIEQQQNKKKKHHTESKEIKENEEQDKTYKESDTNHSSPSPIIISNVQEKLIKEKAEVQEEQEKDIVQLTFEDQKNLEKNTHVIVNYENNFYPGVITKISDDGYFISTMTKALNHWKWPEKIDEICYKNDEIVKIISAPQKINSRGVFSVPEMVEFIA